MRCVVVVGVCGATCLHGTSYVLIIGGNPLFAIAGEQVSHLPDPS